MLPEGHCVKKHLKKWKTVLLNCGNTEVVNCNFPTVLANHCRVDKATTASENALSFSVFLSLPPLCCFAWITRVTARRTQPTSLFFLWLWVFAYWCQVNLTILSFLSFRVRTLGGFDVCSTVIDQSRFLDRDIERERRECFFSDLYHSYGCVCV